MPIKIDYEKCRWKKGGCDCGGNVSCQGCAEVCPAKAITREDVVKIDSSKCINCGHALTLVHSTLCLELTWI